MASTMPTGPPPCVHAEVVVTVQSGFSPRLRQPHGAACGAAAPLPGVGRVGRVGRTRLRFSRDRARRAPGPSGADGESCNVNISVIGCGYLGAVHAASMAELGHEVVGIDVDQRKIEALSQARTPFYEPGFEELLGHSLESGRLRFSSDF